MLERGGDKARAERAATGEDGPPAALRAEGELLAGAGASGGKAALPASLCLPLLCCPAAVAAATVAAAAVAVAEEALLLRARDWLPPLLMAALSATARRARPAPGLKLTTPSESSSSLTSSSLMTSRSTIVPGSKNGSGAAIWLPLGLYGLL